MTSLTKKQIRDAAPTDTLPYRVERKYGDPVLYGKPADVKNALCRDLDELFYLYADQAAAMREAPARRRYTGGVLNLETYNIALVPFGVDIKTYMRKP